MNELKTLLKNDDFQQKLIKDINDQVDIPLLTEKQEASLISFLVITLSNVIDMIQIENIPELDSNTKPEAAGNYYIEKQSKIKDLQKSIIK